MTAVSVDAVVELPGTTTVAPRAVRRIAAQVAREVAGVDRAVEVDAQVTGARTTLDVRLPVHYPQPVGRVTDACRAHLIQRTAALTGLAVARVDIVVSALTTQAVARRRVR